MLKNRVHLNLFQIPIFISNVDLDKIKIDHEGFKKNWCSETLSSFSLKNYIEKDSAVYLLKIIGNELSHIIHEPFNITIHSIWKNKYETNDYQEKHTHAGSHFSFVIYKNVEKSNTILFNPSLNLIHSYYNNMGIKVFQESFTPQCRSNQMIIFPSFVEHMVAKHSNSETIAGNITIEKIRS